MMENKFPDGQPSQAVWNDYVDFKIRVSDNGDDKMVFTGKCSFRYIHWWFSFPQREKTAGHTVPDVPSDLRSVQNHDSGLWVRDIHQTGTY